MKIVHVISNLGNGGAEKFVVELSNEQSTQAEVHLISLKNTEKWMIPPRNIIQGVMFHEMRKGKGFDLLLIFRLYKLIKKINPDIINSHLNATMRYVYIISILFKKSIYIQTIHSNLHSGKIKFFNQLVKLPFYSKRIKQICISKTIANEYRRKYPGITIFHIDNGINRMAKTNYFEEVKSFCTNFCRNDEKLFIAVGSFSSYKNFEMLTSVFNRLFEEKRKSKLIIIGDYERNQFEYDKVQKNLNENILLVGPKDNVSDYMFCADAFVLSSRIEGMPLVVLEALSVGLPIITTPVGGVIDIIQEQINGFISDSFDSDHFYNAILSYLNANVNQIAEIKNQNFKKFDQKYSIKICSQNYIKLYTQLMS